MKGGASGGKEGVVEREWWRVRGRGVMEGGRRAVMEGVEYGGIRGGGVWRDEVGGVRHEGGRVEYWREVGGCGVMQGGQQ